MTNWQSNFGIEVIEHNRTECQEVSYMTGYAKFKRKTN